MTGVDSIGLSNPGWLRTREFDLALICGVTSLALAAAILMAIAPATIGLIWLIDVWFLGYPHVAATFVRLAPDKAAIKRHRFLLFALPMIVLSAIAIVAFGTGIVLIVTIYFYWQWYHTLRQSWGIAQIYRRRSTTPVRDSQKLAGGLFVLVALWGLLHRLSVGVDYFLSPSLPLYDIRVPVWLADGVGVFAIAGLIWWGVSRVRDYFTGELAIAHTLFSASHYLIFIVGYVLMDSVAGGWIVTNIWHTAQYLMVVWVFNQNVAEKACAARAGWYLRLTRNNSAALFFTLCLLSALPVYFGLFVLDTWWPSTWPLLLIANQAINFHHFIVDAVIWRKRRNPAGAPA